MKRGIYFLAIILLLIFIGLQLLEPGAIYLGRRWLEKELGGSVVSIASCNLLPLGALVLSGIEITKPGDFDIKVKRLSLRYIPLFLLRSTFRKAHLTEALIEIEVSDAAFKGFGIQFQGVNLKINRMQQEAGYFSIHQIKYGRVKIEELKSVASLRGSVILLDPLFARAFNGEIQGNLRFNLDEAKEYSANLKLAGLDAEAIAGNFNLDKQVQLSGKLSGNLAFSGKGLDITGLNAEFSAGPGKINVTDARLLKDLARSSKQPLDILAAALKNYDYNSGVASLGIQEENLILQIDFEGEAGRRSLNIIVHNFQLKKEGL